MNIVDLGYRSTHYYALSIAEGWFLVDCGWPEMMGEFRATMKRKGLSPAQVKYMLVTHFHMDHAGLAEEMKQAGSRLILMESQMGAVTEGRIPSAKESHGIIRVSAAGNIPLRFEDSRRFLASIGLDGEIVPTPGHSDDSVSVLLDDGSAFTGDLQPPEVLAEDDAASRASWVRLRERGAKRYYPAHGPYPREM